MRDEPDIVKELREEEQWGVFHSHIKDNDESRDTQGFDGFCDATNATNNKGDLACKFNQGVRFIKKRLKKVLTRKATEKYRLITENTSDLIFLTTFSLQPAFTFVSLSFKKVFGYHPNDLVGTSFFDLVHPDDKKTLLLIIQGWLNRYDERAFAEKDVDFSETVEYRIMDNYGCWHFVDSTINIARDEVLFVSKDVTDRKKAEEKLHESEEIYRTIFENSAVAIMLTDEKERIISWNKYTEKLLGMNREDLYLKPVETLYPSDKWQKIRSKNIQQNGMQPHLEIKMPTRNRGTIDVNLSVSVLKNRMGEIVGSIEVIEDISERKKMENDLRLKDYAILSSINAITLADLQGNLAYVNPSFLKMWEYDSEKNIVGKPWVILWKNKGQCVEIMDTLYKEGGWIGELVAERADRSLFMVQVSASMVKDEADNPICMITSLVDITERKRIEKNFRRFKTISDRAEYGSVIYDIDGNIFYLNQAFARMHDYTPKEILGKNISLLWVEERMDYMKRLHDQLQKTGSFVAKEIWHKKKDGTIFPMLMTSTLIQEEKEKSNFVSATAVDISEIKKVEEKLWKKSLKLQQANQELNEAQRQLSLLNKNLEKKVLERTVKIEELLRQKDEFINQLGHDLKTPLTPIVGLLPLLKENLHDLESREILDVVTNNVNYMKNLVGKTVELARLNSTNIEFSFEDTDLFSQIGEVIENVRPLLEDKKINIENMINKNILVKGDKLRMDELFNNLLTNAIKYTSDERGRITINAKENGDHVTVSVSDNGVGMTEEEIRHIFDEFYKADSSRHDMESHGLGLSICKRIVERHGGKIWAESPGKGKGSTFYMTLEKSGKK
jgi:PAS domain S-box-containing protein